MLAPYGEDAAIFDERIRLCAAGCFVLERGGAIGGYMISHPWRRADPPALHHLLGAIPGDADCWYIHDVAIAPGERGGGAAAAIVERVNDVAARAGLATLALVAVMDADRYWRRLGFEAAMTDALRAALSPYGEDAVYMERPITPLG